MRWCTLADGDDEKACTIVVLDNATVPTDILLSPFLKMIQTQFAASPCSSCPNYVPATHSCNVQETTSTTLGIDTIVSSCSVYP